MMSDTEVALSRCVFNYVRVIETRQLPFLQRGHRRPGRDPEFGSVVVLRGTSTS